MRLVKLKVERFQCIESAEFELGPHLNVLYGPNDLGKSSLAWAVRAVLLVQHGSAHAARFSSWYDAAEPCVTLTFCDDSDRYWRVTKTFGGSAGRSTLHSSKDGRIFTPEASARAVDEKVRELLRWGLSTPGGKGRTAVPESFLTQVLIADQSEQSIRKILFDARLEDDPDESGRERLVAALGALAQDPLFKSILDKAGGHMQRAFTPKGQRKRAAGSPWLEVSERIKSLRAEKDQLEARVKETALVEVRIKELHGHHDTLAAELVETEDEYRVAVRQLAARKERDGLYAEVQHLRQRIGDAEATAKLIEDASAEVTKLEAQATVAIEATTEAGVRASRLEAELGVSRKQLDTALHDYPDAERQMADLQAAVTRSETHEREALGAVAAAKEALAVAAKLATDLAAEDATVKQASEIADDADAAATRASEEVERARAALAAAQDHQRDARSSDRAQARELRRKELDNRGLILAGKRSQVETTLQRAQYVGQLSGQVTAAQAAARSLQQKVAAARDEIATQEAEHAKLEAARITLAQLGAYGRVRELRAEVARATEARAEADRERARAAELRERIETLRVQVRDTLPSADRIQELTDLRRQLEVAEAALGGGFSVEIRPKRSVSVRSTRDGVADPPSTGNAPATLSAKRSIALAIEELVDIEITAGEEAARRAAAELRTRWLRDGESVLVEHGVASLAELRQARSQTDAALRDIAEAGREADSAEKRAALVGAVDAGALREQLATAEADLGDTDREELAIRFARLGDAWQAGLRVRADDAEKQIESSRTRLEQKRAGLAKLEAQHEAHLAEVVRLEGAVKEVQAELTEPWAVVVATCKAEHQKLTAEQEEIERAVAALSIGASDEEAASDAAVEEARSDLEAAEAALELKQKAAQWARVAQVQASTRLETLCMSARQLDAHGVWTAALEGGESTLSLETWKAALQHAQEELERSRTASAEAESKLAEARDARDAAVQALRRKVENAERAAASARTRSQEAEAHHKALIAEHAAAVVNVSEMKVKIAGIDVDALRGEIAKRRSRMLELEAETGDVDDAQVTALEQKITRLRAALRDVEQEVAKARGALEQVGGAVVRERLAEIGEAIRRAEEREHEVEVEYEAWRLLHETLREAESTESAHLGRALAGPVGTRFRQLTGSRYGDLELGAQLEAGRIHVAGELREIAALSAGTQDQLATLLRVCIAQQLRSAIVLDDHLSQSDPSRVAWFNAMLREAAGSVQIVLITCRPQEVLAAEEMCDAAQPVRVTAGGQVHALDLAQVIKRFGALRTKMSGQRSRELEEA